MFPSFFRCFATF